MIFDALCVHLTAGLMALMYPHHFLDLVIDSTTSLTETPLDRLNQSEFLKYTIKKLGDVQEM